MRLYKKKKSIFRETLPQQPQVSGPFLHKSLGLCLAPISWISTPQGKSLLWTTPPTIQYFQCWDTYYLFMVHNSTPNFKLPKGRGRHCFYINSFILPSFNLLKLISWNLINISSPLLLLKEEYWVVTSTIYPWAGQFHCMKIKSLQLCFSLSVIKEGACHRCLVSVWRGW